MRNPVDNKKKWQVVGTILFAIAYPYAMMVQFKLQYSIWLTAAVCVAPPAIAILMLPYKRNVCIVAAFVYFLMMHSSLMIFSATSEWVVPS